VSLAYEPDTIEIRVLDDGRGAGNAATGGHGLIGIRERVSIYGGQLETGTRPEGGYAVSVRLPIGATE
jgi:signal transduction histidine kinase